MACSDTHWLRLEARTSPSGLPPRQIVSLRHDNFVMMPLLAFFLKHEGCRRASVGAYVQGIYLPGYFYHVPRNPCASSVRIHENKMWLTVCDQCSVCIQTVERLPGPVAGSLRRLKKSKKQKGSTGPEIRLEFDSRPEQSDLRIFQSLLAVLSGPWRSPGVTLSGEVGRCRTEMKHWIRFQCTTALSGLNTEHQLMIGTVKRGAWHQSASFSDQQ